MLDLERLLKTLGKADIRFVAVGGVAAMAHGSAHVTGDLDICYARDRANLERLAEALRPFEPKLRGVPDDVPFLWDADTLEAGANFTLITTAGDLDLLGHVSGLGEYDAVAARSETVALYGYPTRILGLGGLIASKEAAGRDKDERMLPELRALRALRDES